MFNKDFYPTPEHVLDSMGIDCNNKIVLEPSAGKGDIVDYIKKHGAKKVIACEDNEDLFNIVKEKCGMLKRDFLQVTADEVSHIDMIVMNPPFSNGVEHLLHAWEIAPGNCEIISLINTSIYNDGYYKKRQQFNKLVRDYGTTEDLGDCFGNAERKTNVEISLIKLYKPSVGEKEFEGFFIEEDEVERQENGMMPYNGVRDVVQRYINSVKCFDEHAIIANKMSELTQPFQLGTFTFSISYDKSVTSKEDFKKALQKNAWKYLFAQFKLNKYVTSGLMRDINAFVEKQTQIPFTMRNIYKMFEIIIGTQDNAFKNSLIEAIDYYTKHTHENRFHVEGWKTNSGHMLNKKFIIDYMFEPGFRDKNKMHLRYNSSSERLNDLIKVICNITGSDYDKEMYLSDFVRQFNDLETNRWYSWSFFDFKCFKKGTMHLKFQNDKHWELVNRKYAEAKGQVLPESTFKKQKSNEESSQEQDQFLLEM